MDLRTKLSERIHIKDILVTLHQVQENTLLREELYRLIYDKEDTISYQALWMCTHFREAEIAWLSGKQNELIDAALVCSHTGKRRLILSLIYQQPASDPPRVDFLDFCMEHMMSREEPPAIQALCIKLCYELTRNIPELQQELRLLLEMLEPDMVSPAQRSALRNTLKAIKVETSKRKNR